MKKKFFVILLVLVILGVVLLYFLPTGGDVRIVRQEIGDSASFSAEEIHGAMETAQEHFRKEFDDCTLLTITYDEEYSDRLAPGWAENYGAEEAIVLYSSFWVGANAEACFNPNSTYSKWQWILTRNRGEDWVLQTWGYG